MDQFVRSCASHTTFSVHCRGKRQKDYGAKGPCMHVWRHLMTSRGSLYESDQCRMIFTCTNSCRMFFICTNQCRRLIFMYQSNTERWFQLWRTSLMTHATCHFEMKWWASQSSDDMSQSSDGMSQSLQGPFHGTSSSRSYGLNLGVPKVFYISFVGLSLRMYVTFITPLGALESN